MPYFSYDISYEKYTGVHKLLGHYVAIDKWLFYGSMVGGTGRTLVLVLLCSNL